MVGVGGSAGGHGQSPGQPASGGPPPLAGSTAVLVLGMHRSGTSAASGVLQCLGVSLGRTVSPPGPSNPRGYFENTRVMLFHEELLAALGRSWDDPRPLPAGWDGAEALAPWRERLLGLLAEEFGETRLWGVKDPRLCRLLPLWLPALGEVGVAARAVVVLRHPGAVAASNGRRTGMPREQALALWLEHVLGAERSTRGLPRAPLAYRALLENWRGELGRVQEALRVSLAWEGGAEAVKALLARELDHHPAEGVGVVEPLAGWVRRAWEAVDHWHREGMDPGSVLDEVAEERARWAPVALPVAQHLERQAEGWRRRCEELQAPPAEAAAAARQVETEQRLAGVVAELDRIRAELGRARGELDAERARRQGAEEELQRLVKTTWMRLASRYWRLLARLRRKGA